MSSRNHLWTADGWAGDYERWDASAGPHKLEAITADGWVLPYIFSRPAHRGGFRKARRPRGSRRR
jgi:hypothetical protein